MDRVGEARPRFPGPSPCSDLLSSGRLVSWSLRRPLCRSVCLPTYRQTQTHTTYNLM